LLGNPTETSEQTLTRARSYVTNGDGPAVLPDFLRDFDAAAPAIRRSKIWLSVFELANVIAILLSLIGFLFIPELERRWYTSAGLAVLAAAIVTVTACCVLAWFE
jgi:hypothetical protein